MADGVSKRVSLPECSICADELSDPRALPCGHSFCGPPKDCLRLLQQSSDGIKCALCSCIHNLNIDALKPLFGIREYLNEAAGVSMGKGDDSYPKCDKHKNVTVSFWCIQCQVKICVSCFETYHDEHPMKSYKKYLQKEVNDKFNTFGKSPESFKEHMQKGIKHCQDQILVLSCQIEKCKQKMNSLEKSKDVYRMFMENESRLRAFSTGSSDVEIKVVDSFLALTDNALPLAAACSESEKLPILKKVTLCADFENIRDWYVNENHDSNNIIVSDHKLWIRAKKYKNGAEKHFLGLFLGCEPIQYHDDWKFNVQFDLCLKNSFGHEKDKTLSTSHTFREREDDWGWNSFIDWGQLMNPTLLWIKDDKSLISVHCTVSVAQ